jgi:hypothetical protein
MDKLETALDDLDGLLEAYRALSDEARDSILRGKQLGTLSLECRVALAALAPTVDARAAQALANNKR